MRVAVIVLGLVVVSTPSQASSSCMTRPEAQQFATSYLYWYGSSHLYWYRSGHCWRAMTPSRRTRVVHRVRVVFNGIAWADHSHALKPENRSQDRELVQREAQAEPNNPEPKWREAMSEMLTANEAPSPSTSWENRWVEIAQVVPLGGDKVVPQEDASANAAHGIEPMVAPMSVLLAFLASLGLTLVLMETLLFRSSKRLRIAV